VTPIQGTFCLTLDTFGCLWLTYGASDSEMDGDSSSDFGGDYSDNESLNLSWTNVPIFDPNDDMITDVSSTASRRTESPPFSDFGEDQPAVPNIPFHAPPPYSHPPEDQESADCSSPEGFNDSLSLSFSWSDVPVIVPNNTSSDLLSPCDADSPPLCTNPSPSDANPLRNIDVRSPLSRVADMIRTYLL
jgi:hypothetical protein